MADHYLANPAQLKIVTGLQAHTEAATRYRLIAHHGEEQDSAAARLAAAGVGAIAALANEWTIEVEHHDPPTTTEATED